MYFCLSFTILSMQGWMSFSVIIYEAHVRQVKREGYFVANEDKVSDIIIR